jgi:hypothetical protein
MGPDGEYGPLPELSKPEEIWYMLSIPGVNMFEMSDEDKSVRFTIDYQVEWDEEHYTALFIQDWQVAQIGDMGQRFF